MMTLCNVILALLLSPSAIEAFGSFRPNHPTQTSPSAIRTSHTSSRSRLLIETTQPVTTPAAKTSLASSNNNDFIDSILNPPDGGDSPSYKCSHMIAIPLEQNHDLLLDLESVQRGILYHCPLLISACIAPVVMRMPLLLVDTDVDGAAKISTDELFGRKSGTGATATSNVASSDDLLTSRDPITQELHEIVNGVVDEMIFVKSTSTQDDGDANVEEERNGMNEDRIEPVMMKFKGLELDGDKNEILHAIGTDDCTTPLFRKMLDEITRRIELKGWKVHLPLDEPQGKRGGLNEDGMTWRPRIPFMRLPNDFFETLPDPKGYDGNWENYSDEMKANYMRVPEEGGNGISPIFFYKWWDDKFCNGKAMRIREVAVYGRTGPMGVEEQAFYIPHLRTKLPEGSRQLQKEEEEEKNYDEKRRSEQGIKMDFDLFDEDDESQLLDKELNNLKSSADRRMLESVYQLSPDQAEEIQDITESFKNESREYLDESETMPKNKKKTRSTSGDVEEGNNDKIQDRQAQKKTDEIISSIAKPMATGDWSKFPKKNKPRPEDNPILKNWRQRVTMAAESEPKTTKKVLPPFPSNEHFVGIWRLVSSPGGPIMDEEELLEALAGDESSSENLILRVDGTIAGGPILDPENQHRAAGGSWKFFQAEFCGKEEDYTQNRIQTRLRVRLLIPPAKEKVVVMEGEVRRGAITSAESVSMDNANELRASSSFGMNRVVKKPPSDALKSLNDGESFIYVSGEVWVEDAEGTGKKNRSKLGRFSLMKRKDRDPNQYQYSIPAPQRYQD